jgi:nucleoporin NUP159
MQQVKTPTPPPPQVADLEDEEDERMRAQLAQKIEPSRTLDEFTAYQNYTGKSLSKTGHAAQIEMVYKDLNGMIDSLGWNVRSIKSFTEYHKRPQSGHQLDRRTLEEIAYEGESGSWFEQWTLSEIQGLKSLEDELEQELDAGRVQDVLGKLSQLARLLHDKAKLMTRLNDVRRQIINRKDPDKVEASRKAPLSKEMADKQKQLRKEYALLLTKLSQAEDTSILLRTRLASHNAQNGNARGVPTVDAVKRTILRMTEFAENHNNDLTVIESRMRKLGLSEPSRPSSSSSRNMGTPRRSRGTSLRNSIADTPFATPPMSRSKMSLSELNRRALTPDIDTTPTANKGYGFSYELSKTPGNELARMNDMVDDNIDALRQTAKRRREVAASLKKALLERGIKETKVHR